ncbi:MAG: protein-glutamate O-methyltransferase CheR [Pirellulaceae bacterium]
MTQLHNDIDAVCDMVKALCGIYLDHSKDYLIESRLSDILKRHEFGSYAELARQARELVNEPLRQEVINAITTNETLFFRDDSPFQALQHKALPELIDARAGSLFPKRLRIWSAASSTGQEVYSIAMTLSELLPDIHTWDVSILGTDISDAAIARASRGWYSQHEIERGLPAVKLDKYFVPEAGGWRVRDELRALARFEKCNLLKEFVNKGPFDIVFCRNVAIYFTAEDRADLFHRVARTMSTVGYLFVGSSESLADLGRHFAPHHHCRSTFYRPNLPAASTMELQPV